MTNSADNLASQARILWAAGAVFLAAEAGGYVMPLLLAPVAATYDISEAATGIVMASQLGSFALAAIGLSPWITALSPRRGAAVALLLIALGNLLSASMPTAWALVAGRIVAGLGEGFAAAVSTAVIARTTDPDRAFARVFTGVVLMALVIFLVLPNVMAGQDARLLFIGLICAPVLAAPALLALSDRTNIAARAARERPRSLSLPAINLCIAIAFYSVAANAYWVYLERIASQIGMTPATYGTVFAASTVLALVGPLAAERLGTRYGRLVPLAIGCTLVGGGGWLATHASTPATFAIGISSSSAALLFGMPYLLGFAAQVDPTGRLAGASRGFNNIGSAIAPALAGAILGVTGAYTSIGWTSLAAATAAFLLVLIGVQRA